MAETKGHISLYSKTLVGESIYLKVEPSRVVVNLYSILSHFLTCSLFTLEANDCAVQLHNKTFIDGPVRRPHL